MSDSEFSPRGDESDFKGGADDDDDSDSGAAAGKKKKAAAKSKGKEKGVAKSKAKSKAASKKKGETKEKAASNNKRKTATGKSDGEQKGAKHPKVTEVLGDEAEQLVLAYMATQNRPYSHLQVFDNLHAAVKKPTVQRILSEGAAAGKLTAKEWKKNKVYWWNQDALASVPWGEDEQRAADAEIKQNMDSVASITAYNKQIESSLANASSLPNDAECDHEIAKLQVELKEKQERLKKLSTPTASGAPVTVTKDQINKAHQLFMKNFLLWKKHKLGVMDVMADIFRNTGNNGSPSADFLEEKGIDTDESFGVDFKHYQALASRKL